MHYIHHTCPSIAPFPPPALDGWLREPSVLPPLLAADASLIPQLPAQQKFFNCAHIPKLTNYTNMMCQAAVWRQTKHPQGALSLAWTEDDRSEASEESFGLETNPPEAIRHRVSVELQVEQGKVVRQVPQKEHRFPVHSKLQDYVEERCWQYMIWPMMVDGFTTSTSWKGQLQTNDSNCARCWPNASRAKNPRYPTIARNPQPTTCKRL